MSLSSISLPKPKNWQDFENHTRVLFACILNDPNTKQNGRSGQQQHGVDVYGYRNGRIDCLVGVQCKKKLETQVTEHEFRAEIDKAKNFKPPISEFVLITTAPRDQKIQECARLITEKLAKTDHPILVSVWGWEDVEEQASVHEKAWKAFDPTWNPFVQQCFEKIDLKTDRFEQLLVQFADAIRSPSSSPTHVSLDRDGENRKGSLGVKSCILTFRTFVGLTTHDQCESAVLRVDARWILGLPREPAAHQKFSEIFGVRKFSGSGPDV